MLPILKALLLSVGLDLGQAVKNRGAACFEGFDERRLHLCLQYALFSLYRAINNKVHSLF